MMSRLRFVLDYFGRLKYWYFHFEKKHLTRIPDFILLNIKKYFIGAFILVKTICRNKDIFSKISIAPENDDLFDFEKKILDELSRHDLYLDPSSIFYPVSAKIVLTNRCNFDCAFCFQDKKKKSLLSQNDIRDAIRILQTNNIKHLSIMGGEVFLYEKSLYSTIKFAGSHGIKTYAITTNGFSFRNESSTGRILKKLKSIGFDGYINISISKEHQRFADPFSLKGISKISRKIFGRNIFRFCLQEYAYAEYLKERKRLKDLIGNEYVYDFIGIVCGSCSLSSSCLRNDDLIWSRCNSIGVTIFPKGNSYGLSYCLGVGYEKKEFNLHLEKNGMIPYRLGKSARYRLFELISKTSMQDIREFATDNRLFDMSSSFPCSLCEKIADDKKVQSLLYNRFILNRRDNRVRPSKAKPAMSKNPPVIKGKYF